MSLWHFAQQSITITGTWTSTLIDKSLFNAVAEMFVLLIQAQSGQLLLNVTVLRFSYNSSHSLRLSAGEHRPGVLKSNR